MKLRYQTGVASLIQFIILSILGVPHALISIISTCQSDHSNCISNLIVSLIFFILTIIWFGFIWFLGFFAQEKRNIKLIIILIGCEFSNIVVAMYINFPGDPNILDKGISAIDTILSLWVIFLAYRLFRAKGGRVVKKHSAKPVLKKLSKL